MTRPSVGIPCWPSRGSLDGPRARAQRLRERIALHIRSRGHRTEAERTGAVAGVDSTIHAFRASPARRHTATMRP